MRENFCSSLLTYLSYYLKVYFLPPIVLPKRLVIWLYRWGNSTLGSYGGSSPSVNESSNFYFNDLKSFIIHLSTPLISGSFVVSAYFISFPIIRYRSNNSPSILDVRS